MKIGMANALVAGFGLALIAGCSHDTAVDEASRWAKEAGLDVVNVQCQNFDTDGDGYLSCTVSARRPDKSVEIVPVECSAILSMNSGCRTPKVAARRN